MSQRSAVAHEVKSPVLRPVALATRPRHGLEVFIGDLVGIKGALRALLDYGVGAATDPLTLPDLRLVALRPRPRDHTEVQTRNLRGIKEAAARHLLQGRHAG